MKNTGYDRVQFRRELPPQTVADHEVFLSFEGDSDAIAFHDWWYAVGSAAFANWLTKRKETDRD